MSPQPALARTLRTTEYFALAFGTMVGVGWLLVIDDWLTRGGPGGAMLGFLIGGVALIPVAFVYGKFVREIPDAASELAYAATVFPPAIGFAASWLMTLAYLIVCPWEAVAVGRLLGYLFPAIQTIEIYHVGGYAVYLPSLLLGFAVTLLIILLNYRGIRISSRFQNYTTFGLLALFTIFTLLGIGRSRIENFEPFFASAGALGGLVSIILVLQIVPYFLTGFEAVPKCCEEADEGFQSGGFVKAIFLGLAVGTLFYVAIIGVVSGLAPWKMLTQQSFATAVAFESAFGSRWIVRLIFAAALVSLLKVFNANFLTASRLVFSLGRRKLIPAAMGDIHPRFQTPTIAVLFCGAVTVIGALLGRSILVPITEVGSLCSAFGWSVTCFAFTRWRKNAGADTFRKREILIAYTGALVAVVFVLLKLIPTIPGSFRIWEYVALATWLALGLFLRKITRL